MDEGSRDRHEQADQLGWDGTGTREPRAKEADFVELKRCLASHLRKLRTERGLTQIHMARLLGSSQPRVARMEAADASVSVDLLVKALLTMGTSREQVGHIIATAA